MTHPISDVENHKSDNPRLWLLRHGETEWAREGRHTGLTDVELTAEGEALAAGIKSRLEHITFDLVLTSPLQRAWRTAELAGLNQAEEEPRVVEWDYGDYEGLTTDEIREKEPGWSIWTHGARGGESAGQVAARADAVIARVRSSGHRNVMLVAHSHFLRLLTARWLSLEPAGGHHFLLGTGKVCTLGWDRETPAVLAWGV
ncbi:histidine phosphatase family protein [Arthrobacter castelli]|uniref:histidine phosphatase family protein n=1 Tax=Arthrobacter castelli TaxID=271431 RepID=UPI0004263B14|nr:histidine phosphatase family protein [Arthrobacter castelli]